MKFVQNKNNNIFETANVGDEVYGFVFGKGVITQILNGYYHILVTFENGHEVPYTIEGIPGWGNFNFRTLYYRNDIIIDVLTQEYDFSEDSDEKEVKKIIKWRRNKILEVKCPSGVWVNYKLCPNHYVETLLEKSDFKMFRKSKQL